MNLDNLSKWIYDAPGRKPAGPLYGLDAGVDKARYDQPREAHGSRKFLLCDTATSPPSDPECR